MFSTYCFCWLKENTQTLHTWKECPQLRLIQSLWLLQTETKTDFLFFQLQILRVIQRAWKIHFCTKPQTSLTLSMWCSKCLRYKSVIQICPIKLRQQENSLSDSNSKGQILLIFSQQKFCTRVFAKLDLTFNSATVKANSNTLHFVKQLSFSIYGKRFFHRQVTAEKQSNYQHAGRVGAKIHDKKHVKRSGLTD